MPNVSKVLLCAPVAGVLFLSACKVPLGNKAEKTSSTPDTQNTAALSISLEHPMITIENQVAYTVAGGAAPYTVSADKGNVSSVQSSGTLTPAQMGTVTVSVVDAAGASVSAQVTVVAAPSLGVTSLPVTLKSGWGFNPVVIDGRVYMFGGCHYNDCYTDKLYIYDPSVGQLGQWRTLSGMPNMPRGRRQHSAAAINGKMYVWGGFWWDGSSHFLGDLSVYDPSQGPQGTWRTLQPTGDVAAYQYNQVTVVSGGKMYSFEGYPGLGVRVYDPSVGTDGQWKTLSPTGTLPVAQSGASVVVINDKMYYYGGYENYIDAQHPGGYKNTLYRFDPSVGTDGQWTQLHPTGENAMANRAYHAAVAQNGKMYVEGGSIQFTGVPHTEPNSFYVYDPSAGSEGSWTLLTMTGDMPPASQMAGWVTLGDKTAIFGLYDQPAQDKAFYLCDFDANSCSTPEGLNGGPMIHAVQSSNTAYVVEGGVAPLQVSAESGSVSVADGSGNYTAPATPGNDVLKVTDALGNVSQIQVQVTTAVTISATTTTIHESSALYLTIAGGVEPYTVTADNGSLENDLGSGNYTAPAGSGTDTIHVMDATGATATLTITYVPFDTLTLSMPTSLQYPSTGNYTISGGSGDFYVWADAGSIPNSSALTGTYTPPQGYLSDWVHVYDNRTGNEVDIEVNFTFSPLQITVDHNSRSYGETATYTIAGGSGSYYIWADNGGVDSGVPTGIYTAPNYDASDVLYVQDNATGDTAQVTINVGP